MLAQIKAIQAKIENLVADLTVLNQEVGKVENQNKVSEDFQKQLNQRETTCFQRR